MRSPTRRINLSVTPEMFAELEARAGAAGVPRFAVGLLERALRGDREPELGLRRPQQVAIDVEPLLVPLRELDARLVEVHRAVEQHGAYLMLRARAGNHEPTLMQARDEAERAVARFNKQRNGQES